jgi:hypothetical protein
VIVRKRGKSTRLESKRTKVAVSASGVKADLPASQAAAVGAQLSQLFSPVVEGAGLIGDYVRFFRQAAAIRAMRRVREIATEAGFKLKPVPPKMLIPWVEAVSLEDEDSMLVELWAHLLVSASTRQESHHVHFVSIIQQLSARQGELLATIVATKSRRHLSLAMDRISEYLEVHRVRRTFEEAFHRAETSRVELTLEEAAELVSNELNSFGVEVEYADVGIGDLTNYAIVDLPYEGAYSDDAEVDFAILEAVGLIRRVSEYFELLNKYSVTLKYYHLTHLGSVFAEACGIVRDVGIKSVAFGRKHVALTLTDETKYELPLTLHPKLATASREERLIQEFTHISVRWPTLNVEISVADLLDRYSAYKTNA